MATRAVARRRTVVYSRRRSARRARSRSETSGISVAVVMGFVPTIAEMVRQGQAGWAFKDILATPVYNFTGYSMTTGQWSFKGIINGWTPVLAGYAAHWLANRFGINRAISRLTRGAVVI